MISKKEMMIVDAVNKSKCEIKALGPNKCNTHVSAVTKNNVIHKEGEVFLTSKVFDNNCWVNICTIEEYNQCIREMSEGAFVPDAKPEFVYGQDVYLSDPLFSSKGIKFGCLALDGEGAIILYEGGYAYVKLSGLSSKPFKTKEEIELEVAKKKQVDDYSYVYSHYFKDEGQAREMFSHMQNSNELAEILLPLEPK